MLNALRRSSARSRLVRTLYTALVSQARQPSFYAEFGVEDTIDGRFDMVVVHAWLVLEKLQNDGQNEVARRLSVAIFVGFAEALRDLGAGDMGMGRKIKQMGDAFNGRMKAYGASASEAELALSILRNVYRGDAKRQSDALAVARYAMVARAHLAKCNLSLPDLDFGPFPQRLA